MEAIVILVSIYGGFWLLGTIFSYIGELFEKRKAELQNQASKDFMHEELVAALKTYKTRLAEIGYDEDKFNKQKYGSAWNIKAQPYSELLKKCPTCENGYLRLRKGKYGKFLGCSNWPHCNYILNIKDAKLEYKNNINNEIISKIRNAYL